MSDKDRWNKDRAAIIGSAERVDTLEFYKQELKYLDEELNSDLETRYEERRGIVRDIFDKKQEIISVYKDARNRLNTINWGMHLTPVHTIYGGLWYQQSLMKIYFANLSKKR